MGKLEKLVNQFFNYSGKINSFKNPFFILMLIVSFGLVLLSYSNHFSNSFQFDDIHTIKNNPELKQIDFSKFFSDGSTFSSLPSNRSYRPLITFVNAIDYNIADGSTIPFHIHIFSSFIIVGILIFVLTHQLLSKFHLTNHTYYWSLLCSVVFCTLCANAETVNYIIQRAEIISGLFILLGLITYIHGGFWKKYYLYLVFPLIGFFSKEMAFMFWPLLLLYILIFEENIDLTVLLSKESIKKVWSGFFKSSPALIVTIIFLFFYIRLLPETFSSGAVNAYEYFITQPFVISHYVLTFIYPYNLSADTDWQTFSSILNFRVLFGFLFVIFLIYIAFRASKFTQTKIISFGILWFLISLLPTSSIIPFAEVLNDHRCFIPYIGLTLVFVFGLKFIGNKLTQKNQDQTFITNILTFIFIVFIVGNAYGVYQRNIIWKTPYSLWKDVTVKSPNNGRGLMNFGLELMAIGNYADAEEYFVKAKLFNPNYYLLDLNQGILYNAMGNKDLAEKHFRNALINGYKNYESYWYYATFLKNEGRYKEATDLYHKAYHLNKNYLNTQNSLFDIYHITGDWQAMKILCVEILSQNPESTLAKEYLYVAENKISVAKYQEIEVNKNPTAEKYLNLSLIYFKENQYQKCIELCQKALVINPNYAEAYNNIGITNARLGNIELAKEAYEKALKIKPDFVLAKNNLQDLQKTNIASGEFDTVEGLINKSLALYNQGDYKGCIKAAEMSIKIKPTSNAYNNICSAYNQLKQYEIAIKNCEEALKLDPNNVYAKGNKNFAINNR